MVPTARGLAIARTHGECTGFSTRTLLADTQAGGSGLVASEDASCSVNHRSLPSGTEEDRPLCPQTQAPVSCRLGLGSTELNPSQPLPADEVPGRGPLLHGPELPARGGLGALVRREGPVSSPTSPRPPQAHTAQGSPRPSLLS